MCSLDPNKPEGTTAHTLRKISSGHIRALQTETGPDSVALNLCTFLLNYFQIFSLQQVKDALLQYITYSTF